MTKLSYCLRRNRESPLFQTKLPPLIEVLKQRVINDLYSVNVSSLTDSIC